MKTSNLMIKSKDIFLFLSHTSSKKSVLFYKYLNLFLILSFFVACGSNAPTPEIDPLVLKESEAIVIQVPTPDTATTIQTSNQTLDTTTQPKEVIQISMDSIIKQEASIVNPYQDIPALVEKVLKHADTLLSNGESDSAASYLEKFIVLKPLWDEWQAQAQTIYTKTKRTQAERAEEFKSLTLQITNMNSVGSSFELIKEFTDSLISLKPGDSLILWAQKQNQLAYKKNLNKARQEKEKILTAANTSNQFKTAQEQIRSLKAHYYYFEDSLQLESTLLQLEELEASISKKDQLFWETNDPQKSLEQAQKWTTEKKYSQAKSLLLKLKSSVLRQKAIEQMDLLAESYCNDERKKTSVLYKAALKTKKTTQKKEKLTQAIEALNRCLDEYPEYKQKDKVLNNKQFIEKELSL